MSEIIAYCFASGRIEFGATQPKGALPIVSGEEERIRRLIGATARHAYDGETLLVPGVPEAPDQIAGVDALIRFRDWIEEHEAKPEGDAS